MIDNWLSKTKIKNAFEKLAQKLFLGKLSANHLTIIGLILGLLSAFFIFLSGILQWTFVLIIISAIFMSFSFLFDALDGTLARLEKPTKFGGILDIFCDRTVEVTIILALISTDPIDLMWPGLFTLAAIVLCISMFLVVGGAVSDDNLNERQKVIYYRKGLMERSETFIFLMLITIFYPWRFILLWIFAILVFITAILRLKDAYLIFNKNTKLE